MNTIKVNALADAVNEAMSEYVEDCTGAMNETAKEVAKDCAEQIRKNAKTAFGSGEYAKSWTSKQTQKSVVGDVYTVYAKSPGAQLAHLLEYGHKKWLWGKNTGGRVEGRAHIRPAVEKAAESFVNKIKVRLSK